MVKRYSPDWDEDKYGGMHFVGMAESDMGEWLKAEDHESECAALRAEVERLRDSCDDCYLNASRARRFESQLAAANALLCWILKCKWGSLSEVFNRISAYLASQPTAQEKL